ncbi:hypothetical protein EB061_02630 [bacterium]|jgi:hypothetical protein|nr:hypothetical protein [bacterium]
MSLLFLLIKVYPAFGLVLGLLFFDLARTLKRGANKAWIGVIGLSGLCFATAVLWVMFRGDRHADQWYRFAVEWLRLP